MTAINYIQKFKTCGNSILHLDLDYINKNINEVQYKKLHSEIVNMFIQLHKLKKYNNEN